MTLYKEDWEQELEVNRMARDKHLKGYEILSESVKFFEKMVNDSKSRPDKEQKN